LTYFGPTGEREGTYPAMVARVRDVAGAVVGLHVTYLDGPKKAEVPSPKKMVGSVKTAAVRLWPVGDALAVAEGLETSLAVRDLWGLPVWAALSAGGLEAFEVPPEVKTLVICGDNDASYTGQAAAYSLAKRLAQRIEVQVCIPKQQGADWLDVLREGFGRDGPRGVGSGAGDTGGV